MAVTHVDMETYDPTATTLSSSELLSVTTPDPRYTGLNRAQRRKAMAVENRAWRKQQKERSNG